MSDTGEKLQHELETAQRALAEAEARFARMEAEHQAAAKEFENIRKQIVRAHQEWMTSLDVVADPIFLHDRNFHILRCNRAYQRYAGIPYKQIIGQPYYEVFPKTHAPLPNCLQAMGNLETDEHIADAEIVVGDTTYRSRAYAVTDEQGSYLYSIHTLEDINEQLRSKRELKESELQYRRLFESAKDGILILDAETGKIIDANPFILNLLSYSLEELTGKILWEIGLFADIEASKRASKELLFREYIRYEDMPLQTKDGRRVEVEFVSNLYEVGERKVIQCNIRDIAERRLAEENLKLFRTLLDNSSDAIEVIDPVTLRFLDVNETACLELGYSREELLSMSIPDIDPTITPESTKYIGKQIQESGTLRIESIHRRKDGSMFPVEISSKLIELDRPYALSIVRNITESKQAEEEIVSLARFPLENPHPVLRFLRDGTIVFANASAQPLLNLWGCEVGQRLPDDWVAIESEMLSSGANKEVEVNCSGRVYSVTLCDIPTTDFVNAYGLDITGRKRSESALLDSEEKFRQISASAQDAILMMDDKGCVVLWNKSAEKMFGYRSDELLGKELHDWIIPERYLGVFHEKFPAFVDTGSGPVIGKTVELEAIRKNGEEFPVEVSFSSAKLGGRWHAIGLIRDITDRKQAEEALGRANRALRTLSACNEVLVRATSEDQLLQTVVNIIVEQSGYELSEVCYAEDNPEKSITLMAWSGMDEKFFWVGHPSWADTEEGQLPIASAIRSGMTQIRRDIAAESKYKPWRDEALARGHVSNIALPFVENGRTFGALSIYSSDAKTFDEEEVRLLEELANDLAYGVATLRTRLAHDQQAAILLESMEQSIQTVAYTVEARDPYTAGHQRRVAELATAIAQEMGLTEDQVNATHLAAIIHDLGKIRVPAEILSKPGKLTEIEFMLIKTHPQAGYDILKNVKFPWPIADIILQHHEKLDGTGYPQGLKGEQILIESRIMSVADVVEAMSSHRPYRAALGIEPALNEIKRGRGIAYDAAVVDACLRLFAEKRFEFGTQ